MHILTRQATLDCSQANFATEKGKISVQYLQASEEGKVVGEEAMLNF